MDKAHPLPANVLDLLLDAVCVVDAEGRFVFVSAAFETIFGYAPDEVIGTRMIELVHPDERARTLQAVAEIVGGQPKRHFHNRYVRKDGRVVDIMWSARWLEADRLRIAVARDVTELKRAEALQAAVYAVSEAVHDAEDLPAMYRVIHRILGRLLPAAHLQIALYDQARDELAFAYQADGTGPWPQPRPLGIDSPIARVIRGGQPLLLASADAADVCASVDAGNAGPPMQWLGVPLVSQHRAIGALVVQDDTLGAGYSAQDLELLHYVSTQVAMAIERKQAELRLQYVARHDQLTGLPNRQLFQDRVDTALARARRDHGRLALLYVDLDRFKQVNDTVGHVTGDLLLHEVGQRIRRCVREADTVGRIGGDEFLVLVVDVVDGLRDAALVADKIRASLEQPFDVDGHRLQISSSIGIAAYPEHGDEFERLVRHADSAMYLAKQQGGNRASLAQVQGD